ncbi:protein Smaug homolog 1 isoform X4 [Dunckerocampus dactyliophorus]|uniref:protein Smaug homolog 1 isoform X4 n=1 Tax=Dunckerocampus dactyliophorus TaxID=161453 RepID=UPI00240718B7|nr:protein Smaug homolog 1 isoform X4 [Dunckerocampus dactyliophorus]
MMFRDQVGVLAGWFKGWNECEQTVALLSLLKRVSRTQARFLQLCLEHSLADCTELQVLEADANNPDVISQWQGETKERVISLVLTHLPLLKPGNVEAKGEYMRLLPRILAHTIEHGRHLEESRQLLSYALIHPATSLEDRAALALWLNHLEERAAARGDSLERPSPTGPHHRQSTPPSTLTSGSSINSSSSGNLYSSHHHHQRYGSDDRLNGWQSSRDSGLGGGWQQQAYENGHLPLYPSSSVPATINTVGTGGSGNAILTSSNQPHSPLKRSVSLTPPMSGPSNHPMGPVWLSQEDLRSSRGPAPDHAPLSPQSSIASSGSGGSEHLEEGSLGGGSGLHRSSFHEEGSGMRDVPSWLKGLRLHKYAALFSTMTYDEMMSLTEEQLEAQKVTKGARHKIVISIQKLKERQNLLRSLEKDVLLEGGNLRVPLQELHNIITTPIKAFSGGEETSLQRPPLNPDAKSSAPGSHLAGGGGEVEASSSVIAEGDLPSQFIRVMGKVCTQLLVSRSDEDNISSYLQLIDSHLARLRRRGFCHGNNRSRGCSGPSREKRSLTLQVIDRRGAVDLVSPTLSPPQAALGAVSWPEEAFGNSRCPLGAYQEQGWACWAAEACWDLHPVAAAAAAAAHPQAPSKGNRVCGLPTPEAATVCPVEATALYNGHAHCQFTQRLWSCSNKLIFSCQLQSQTSTIALNLYV